MGLKRANPWGLHDVLGNVWEWTAGCIQCDRWGRYDLCSLLVVIAGSLVPPLTTLLFFDAFFSPAALIYLFLGYLLVAGGVYAAARQYFPCIVRGGAWSSSAAELAQARRTSWSITLRARQPDCGFRVVREIVGGGVPRPRGE